MNNYEKRLEEFRLHYLLNYGLRLDDEILFFFIRVNELQVDLKKQIMAIKRPVFKSGWDYFMFGLGKFAIPALVVGMSLVTIMWVYSNRPYHDVVSLKNGSRYLRIQQGDSAYYVIINNGFPVK